MLPGIIYDRIPEKDDDNYLGWETLEFVQAVHAGMKPTTDGKSQYAETNYIFICNGEELFEMSNDEFCYCVCECYKMRKRIYEPNFKSI